ncbi:hypothetical protein CH063_12655 [Colletotrichum higginsianum]|uniref:Uncharacterized protein n=1 Tax=Colletotrichum higginsianum (strain IMI 349063) TaxID=759273 RepID=H1VR97_COLHI|nr:hypothetical protein CH63R_11712 [Colletotrichum higginsianum IMI 349063]OBR05009.1 hypothetical protein CH63R_11712 [Colletotrichum higginsianum IMI 349063]CCF42753.1 hypothetical protein CH063_12655 [Colletotrichum higginsianum]
MSMASVMYTRLPLDPRLLVVTLDIPADSKSELPPFAPSVEANGFVRKAGRLKRGEAFNLSFRRGQEARKCAARQLGFMHDLVDHLW